MPPLKLIAATTPSGSRAAATNVPGHPAEYPTRITRSRFAHGCSCTHLSAPATTSLPFRVADWYVGSLVQELPHHLTFCPSRKVPPEGSYPGRTGATTAKPL